MRRLGRSEPITHRRPNPLLPFHQSQLQMEIRPAPCCSLSEPKTDYSPARSGGPLSAPPRSPSQPPPKSAQGSCLSESITDCSPHAPAVCCQPRRAYHPLPRSSLRRAAAFQSLLLTAVPDAPAVRCQPLRAHHPLPRSSRHRAAAFQSLLLTAVPDAPAVRCQPSRAHHPLPRSSRHRVATFPSLLLTAVPHAPAVRCQQELILFPQRSPPFLTTKGSFSPDPSRRFPTLYVPIMSCSLSRSRPAAYIAWPGAAMACFSQHKLK